MKANYVLPLLFFVAIGCGKAEVAQKEPQHNEPKHQEAPHDGVELSAEAARSAGVATETVKLTAFQTYITAPGVVESITDRRAMVTPPAAGRILSLLVNVGDDVRKGQSLATLESVDLAERSTAITEAERSLGAAKADAARAASESTLAQSRAASAQTALQRQRQLARTGAFSQPNLQAAERDLNDAQAALESAQKEAVVHRAQLERAERLFKQELVSRIEVENARLDVEKDRIAQERAERAIAIARTAFQREREIAQGGLSNAREVQAAEADLRASKIEAERAKIAVRSAQAAVTGAQLSVANAHSAYAALKGSGNSAQQGRMTLSAPIEGRVAHRAATVGQAVERTTELLEIDDLRVVFVTAQVPERQITALKQGAKVSVTTDAYPGRRFEGSIETIGGRLDPKTRTLPVQCRISNGDTALRPEMFAQVALGQGPKTQALTVAESSVFEENAQSFVFILGKDGRYAETSVKVGRSTEGRVEILSGLAPGAQVVVEGVFTLRSQAQKAELKGHED